MLNVDKKMVKRHLSVKEENNSPKKKRDEVVIRADSVVDLISRLTSELKRRVPTSIIVKYEGKENMDELIPHLLHSVTVDSHVAGQIQQFFGVQINSRYEDCYNSANLNVSDIVRFHTITTNSGLNDNEAKMSTPDSPEVVEVNPDGTDIIVKDVALDSSSETTKDTKVNTTKSDDTTEVTAGTVKNVTASRQESLTENQPQRVETSPNIEVQDDVTSDESSPESVHIGNGSKVNEYSQEKQTQNIEVQPVNELNDNSENSQPETIQIDTVSNKNQLNIDIKERQPEIIQLDTEDDENNLSNERKRIQPDTIQLGTEDDGSSLSKERKRKPDTIQLDTEDDESNLSNERKRIKPDTVQIDNVEEQHSNDTEEILIENIEIQSVKPQTNFSEDSTEVISSTENHSTEIGPSTSQFPKSPQLPANPEDSSKVLGHDDLSVYTGMDVDALLMDIISSNPIPENINVDISNLLTLETLPSTLPLPDGSYIISPGSSLSSLSISNITDIIEDPILEVATRATPNSEVSSSQPTTSKHRKLTSCTVEIERISAPYGLRRNSQRVSVDSVSNSVDESDKLVINECDITNPDNFEKNNNDTSSSKQVEDPHIVLDVENIAVPSISIKDCQKPVSRQLPKPSPRQTRSRSKIVETEEELMQILDLEDLKEDETIEDDDLEDEEMELDDNTEKSSESPTPQSSSSLQPPKKNENKSGGSMQPSVMLERIDSPPKPKEVQKSTKKVTPHQVRKCIANMKNIVQKGILLGNLNEVYSAMEMTSDYRRKMVMDPKLSVHAVIKEFPALTSYQVVKAECNRLLDKKLNMLEELLDENFVRAANSRKFQSPPKLFVDAKNVFKKTQSAEIRKITGMVCLAFYLAEKHAIGSLFQLIIKRKKIMSKLTPTMVLQEEDLFNENREIKIFADGIEMLQVPNFYEGVITIYSLYYVFDMIYDKNVSLLFQYFDFLLGLPQSSFTLEPAT